MVYPQVKSLTSHLDNIIAQRKATSLYRTRHTHEGAQTATLLIDGKTYLSFCSNDYLGLAAYPEIIQALSQSAEKYGVGSGAAHLVSGHSTAHQALEHALADYTGRQRALLFSTGYMANLGVMSGLMGRDDVIFMDKLNHASLIDGALLARAKLLRYPHADLQTLERQLQQHNARHRLIATDGVFSMDGSLAPLPQLVELAQRYDAWLMVDDAHGLGVLGAHGRGCLEHYQLDSHAVPILMGTLGKAFGVFGAFVAGSDALIESLIQKARSYIYTTALPSVLADATRTSLRLADKDDWRREKLQQLVKQFRHGIAALGLPLSGSELTPIQPLILGSATKASSLSEALYSRGILVTAIRPPTVPEGTARLRITLSAAHEPAQIETLLYHLSECLKSTKIC